MSYHSLSASLNSDGKARARFTCGSHVSYGNDSRSVSFVRNSGGGRSGTPASTSGARSLTSDKVRFRFQRTLTILTGLAQQGGVDASSGHEIRTQWTAASLRQQTASALGRHHAASNTATSVLVPHMIRLALSLSSVNTAGSSKIQSHPKSSLSGVTVVTAPKGSSTLR